ncbi:MULTISPECIES: hypothetical protein [Actinosynnema]|uniref:MFS transporter small subunit n=1 Tax=Actinosynnema TaxID=40566 RepID=UPI0020A2A78F|nr:hypothetical protein [Actinosynnema pretiosum]MCP2092938.1 hypothetical protein [Actinosynnema pretiosum]
MSETTGERTEVGQTGNKRTALVVVSWLWVGVPLAYGLFELIRKVTALFTG